MRWVRAGEHGEHESTVSTEIESKTDVFSTPQRTAEERGWESARTVHIRHSDKRSVKGCGWAQRAAHRAAPRRCLTKGLDKHLLAALIQGYNSCVQHWFYRFSYFHVAFAIFWRSDGKYLYTLSYVCLPQHLYLENCVFFVSFVYTVYKIRQTSFLFCRPWSTRGRWAAAGWARLHEASFPSKQLVPEKLLGSPGSGMKTCPPRCAASKTPRQPNTQTWQDQTPPALPSASWASSAQEL